MPQTHLIDVRSAPEYTTGHLTFPSTPPIPTPNIEYTQIASLPTIYQRVYNIAVGKDDRILLYCRSGRRSGIARMTLMEMGFSDVSDLGAFEDARAWLEREGRNVVVKDGRGGVGGEEDEAKKKEGRLRGFEGLVEGLKGLE